MKMYDHDSRNVLTLDAGGTNFVFSAIQANREIIDPVTLPSQGENLDRCLATIRSGFHQCFERVDKKPSAISFAFPGPADYPGGIIGDLVNLPCFQGGVALGPMLEEEFQLPVFINNDGDLFVYGEAIAGFLPKINELLRESGSLKRYNNLFGVTLGTGFGGGLVHGGELYLGDNAAGAEIWAVRNKLFPDRSAEESVSIRGVRRAFAAEMNIPYDKAPSPREIYGFAMGTDNADNFDGSRMAARPQTGMQENSHQAENRQKAAEAAFRSFGEVIGDTLANMVTVLDCLMVIGGGMASAYSLFSPALIDEMNGLYAVPEGDPVIRMESRVYDLEKDADLQTFLKGEPTEIRVPGSSKTVPYDPVKRLGVGLSVLGTSRAVGIGAYTFALHALDRE
ncbi:hypothetical protein BVY01_03315 [bacterium I07]|nr:hypothetical protein BVY01_03315 [bacterium I07]